MPFFADPLLGTTLGGYQLQAILGSGNMGRTFRAVRGDEAVAIKVLHESLVGDPELVERFHREFVNAREVRHPNVVEMLDFGRRDAVHFQIAELLEGRPLLTLLDEAPLPLRRVVHLGAQIAEGLRAAHEHGVVHRDLKPENIMVDAHDRVKLFDFGLARANAANQPKLTVNDMRLGTPMFMAPEYIASSQLDPRADLYALGVALFEMATGTEPFAGPPFKILHLQVTQVPPKLREVQPSADPSLEGLVAQLLEKDPAARPQTAREVADRLRALV